MGLLRWVKRAAWGLLGAVVVIVAAAAAGIGWLDTASGKAWLTAEINTSEAGVARIGTIGGSLPFHPAIDHIDLLDPAGVWATLADVHLDLQPWDLLHGQLTVARLSAAEVDMRRTPQPAASKKSTSAPLLPPVNVDVQRFTLGTARLPADLLGEPTVWTLNASAHLIGQDAGLTLDLAQQDAASPVHASARFDLSNARVAANVVLDDPGGVLLRRAAGEPLPLQLRVTDDPADPQHDPADWHGRLTADIGDRARLVAALHLAAAHETREFDTDGTFENAGLVPARLASLLDGGLKFHLAVRQVAGGGVSLDGLALESAAFHAEGTGRYDSHGRSVEASLRLNVPDLARLSAMAGQTLAGNADVVVNAKGPLEALNAELDVHGAGLAYGTTAIDDATARLHAAKDRSGRGYEVAGEGTLAGVRAGGTAVPAHLGDTVSWRVTGSSDAAAEKITLADLSVASAGFTLAGNGSFDRPSQDVTGVLRLDASDLASLSAAVGKPLAGHGRITASVDGNLAGAARVTVQGGLDDLKTGIAAADALSGGRLRIDVRAARDAGGKLALEAASLDLAHATLSAQGGDDPAADRLSGRFRLAADDLGVLKQAGLAAGGRLALDGEVGGSPSAPTLDVHLRGTNLAWQGARIDQLTARVQAAGAGSPSARLVADIHARDLKVHITGDGALSADRRTVSIPQLRVAANNGVIEARLRTALDSKLTDGRITAHLPDLARWSPLVGTELGGRIELALALATKHGQSADLTAVADGLRAGAAQVHHLSVTAALTDLLRRPAGKMQLAGDGIAASGAEIRTVRMMSRSSAPDRFGFDATVNGDFHGPVSLSASGEVALDRGATRLTLRRLDGGIVDTPLHLQRPLLVSARGAAMTLQGLSLAIGDGRITGDAKADAKALAVKLDAHALPVASAGRLAGRNDLAGAIDAQIDIAGPPARPQGRITVDARDLRAGPQHSTTPILALTAEARIAPSHVDLTATAGIGGNQLLAASATVPVVFGPQPGMAALARDRPIEAKVHGAGELASLADFLPLAGDRVAGHYDLSADVGGTVARPQVAGRLALDHGHYESLAAGTIVDALELQVDGDQDRIVLRRLSATDGGKGRLDGSGEVSLGAAPVANLTVSLKGFQALRRSDATLTASGSTTVSGKLTAPAVVTRLTVDQAEFFIPDPPPSAAKKIPVTVIDSSTGQVLSKPEPQSSSAPGGGAAILDIAVHVPGRTFVRGRGLDSEWQGDIQVKGSSSAPEITGALNVLHGTFSFFGKDMQLQRGTVTFTGGHKIEPMIDVLAETTTSDATFDVGASGTPDALKIKLSSNPAMPQDEILSHLMFGREMTSLTPAEGVQLAQAAATLSSGGPGILDKVRHKLGLDVLNIGSMNDNDSMRPSPRTDSTGGSGGMGDTGVSGGKYIANGVYVGAEQGVNGETRSKVQVEVLPHVNVESSAGTRSESVGVNWKTDY